MVLKGWAEGRGADAPKVDWEVTVSEPSSCLSSQRRLPEDRVTPAPFCSSLGTCKLDAMCSPTLHSEPRAMGSAFFLWMARLVAPSSACLSKGLREDHSSRQYHFSPPAIAEKAIGCRTATEAKKPLLQNREDKIKQAASLSCGVSLLRSTISLSTQLQGRELW